MKHSTTETTGVAATCLLDVDYEASFAFRAARVAGIQGLQLDHPPGSRGDFLQALQQLGAEARIFRLRNRRNARPMVRVHVSCSRDVWTEIFAEPEFVEEVVAPSAKHALHRWNQTCSDGSVTCIGHLFEHSPGVQWVVVMRITFLG